MVLYGQKANSCKKKNAQFQKFPDSCRRGFAVMKCNVLELDHLFSANLFFTYSISTILGHDCKKG